MINGPCNTLKIASSHKISRSKLSNCKFLAKRDLHNQRGAGLFTLLFFGTITVVALYSAYFILPFYYYYYELRNQFQQHIRVASTYTDQEIREKLNYHIKKMQIPIDRPEDLEISRSGRTMTIRLPYKEIFYVTWRDKIYDLYVFKFDAKVAGDF